MNNCETCVHAIVDPIWGDIKCRVSKCFCTGREIENGCDKWKGKDNTRKDSANGN